MRESKNLGPAISEGLNTLRIGIELFDFQVRVPKFFDAIIEGSHFQREIS